MTKLKWRKRERKKDKKADKRKRAGKKKKTKKQQAKIIYLYRSGHSLLLVACNLVEPVKHWQGDVLTK